MSTYEDILGLAIDGWGATNTPRQQLIAEHLTFADDFDITTEPYEFNQVRFYVRKRDGMVLYAHDQGCSCPVPFEFTTVGELRETTLDRIGDVLREQHKVTGYNDEPLNPVEVENLRARLRALGARRAGEIR